MTVTVAAKEDVFDRLLSESTIVADLPNAVAEEAYEAQDARLIRAITEAGRRLFAPDFLELHVYVSDNWWPNHTRYLDASVDTFTKAYFDGLRSCLTGEHAAWRIQVVVHADLRDGQTMVGSIAIWADRVLIDRALYALLRWRGFDLRCLGELLWQE